MGSLSPLGDGWHAWVWPAPPSAAALERDLRSAADLGLAGVIVQDGLDAPAWFDRVRRELRADPHQLARSLGVRLALGLGLDGRQGHREHLGDVVRAIVGCCDRAAGVMLNWEGRWGDERADRGRAQQVVGEVLAQRPQASRQCTDAPWWAPNFVMRTKLVGGRLVRRRAPTHPNAPVAEWGQLCTSARYVQAYGANVPGAPDGASTSMLAWARSEGQYPALGVAAARVLPAHQLYVRSVTDHVATLEAEPMGALWVLRGLDASARAALRYRRALAALGYSGPGASERFQRAANIVDPTTVGPRAWAAAGLGRTPPKGVVWHRRRG